MAHVERLKELVAKLQARAAAAARDVNVSVAVGYTASYALWVHEARGMVLKGRPRPHGRGSYWDPLGVAKAGFLLDPARRLAAEIGKKVRQDLLRGRTMSQALLTGGLWLQRESQRECPVDTGNLRASAFTRLEPGAPPGGGTATMV